MSVRLKYYAKIAVCGILAAAAVIMAVFALTGDEIVLQIRSAEIYGQNSSSVLPMIDINTASVRELQKLNGIGEVTARAIVAYRDEHGNFSSVDELLNVRGIGQATLERIRPYISL